jgi:acyl-CoA thioester hydrolase
MDAIGLDAPGRAKHRRTIYTLEAHITYRAEIAGGAALRVVTQILGVDAKRVYAHSAMHVGSDPAVCATHEALYICVDTDTRRSAPWPEAVRAALDAMAADHAAAGEPATAGLSLGRHRLKT